MPEFEFPGVIVEEVGGQPKPIDGVPTDGGGALGAADRVRWIYGIAIGGAALAGLGLWLAMIEVNVLMALVRMSGGVAGVVAIWVAAIVLGMSRALVESRRRRAGRPPLRPGRLALGLGVFQLANLVAWGICLAAVVVSLLVARAYTSVLVWAGINVVVGCALAWLVGGALRDLLLLVQAARADR